MAKVQKQQVGGDELAAKQAEEARRVAEELRKAAEAAERARKAAEAARLQKEQAAKANSAMEEARKVGRVVRGSVRFEVAKKLPQQRARASVKLEVANARSNRVKELGALEASKAGVVSSAWLQAVKKNDVGKMEQLALPRLEKVALGAADLVDRVQTAAASSAAQAVHKNLGEAVSAAAKVHGIVSKCLESPELKGRAAVGAEGIRETLPKLGLRLAEAAQWAGEGLKLGDIAATAVGARRELASVKDTVGLLHQVNDRIAHKSWQTKEVRAGLDRIEGLATRAEQAVDAAEARARFVQEHAVGRVNGERRATGYRELERNAPPEQWMPAEGEKPAAAQLRRSDDPGSEVARLTAKLEELKARKAAGENVDEQWGSVKANLKNAQSLLEAGATSMTGASAAPGPGGAEGLPPGVTMGPDGVPMDKDGMPLALSEADVQKLGTGLAPGGTQIIWNRCDTFPNPPPGLASAWANKAQEQGLLTQEQLDKANELANKTLPGAEKQQFEAGDMALLAKQYGISTEKMDPNQLAQAARLINTATTVEEQRATISAAVRNFQLIADNKTVQFSDKDKLEMMWAAAQIPGHAVQNVKPHELEAKFKEVVAATNTPGEHSFKVGKHNTTIKVAEDGSFQGSTCKKPSFLSKLGSIAKVALKVGSFIPGPIGIACRVANAVVGAVSAIKNGNWLGAIASVAGGVAAGAAGFAGKVADKVGNIAKGVQSAMSGIQAAKSGSIGGVIGAAAGVMGAAAGALGDKFKSVAGGLSKWSDRMQKVASGATAAEGVIKANQAVSQAKKALEEARASGDPQAIAQALEGVEQAERGKRSAILGAGSAALSIAAGSATKDKGLQVGLKAGAGALNAARNVNDQNYVGAVLDGASVYADLKQGTEAPDKVTGKDGEKDRFGLRQAVDMAQGLDGWRQAEKAASEAKKGISAAEQQLQAARRSGDPEQVKQAEEALKKAKRGASDAELGAYQALSGANQAVDSAYASWTATRTHDKRVAQTLQTSRTAAEASLAAWQGLATDADGQVAALASREQIAEANEKLAAALERGDNAAISRAKDELDAAVTKSEARLKDAKERAPLMTLPVSNRNFNDLLASVPGGQAPIELEVPPPIETKDYRIKKGDSLEEIAVANGLTVEELMRANGITDKNKIREGANLRVPVASEDEAKARRFAGGVAVQKESNKLNAADQKYQTIADDPTQPEGVRKAALEQKAKLDGLQTTYEEALRRGDQKAADAAYAKLKTEHGNAGKAVSQARATADAEARQKALSNVATAANREVQAALDDNAKVHSMSGEGFIDGVANVARSAKDVLTGNQEKMQTAASSYQQAALELQLLANRKGGSTAEEQQAALDKLMRAKSEFSAARGEQLGAQSEASVFDVARLGARQGGKAIEEGGVVLADKAADVAKRAGASDATVAGIRDGLKEAAKQTGGVFEGLGVGITSGPEGLAKLGAALYSDPKGTTEALGKLAVSAGKALNDADPMQRMVRVAANAAQGKYQSIDDVMKEVQDYGRSVGNLGRGVAGMVVDEEARAAWSSGDYGKAVGIVIGQVADVGVAGKALKETGEAAAKQAGKLLGRDAAKDAAKAGAREAGQLADDVAKRAAKPGVEQAYADGASQGADAVKKAEADFAKRNPGKTMPSAEKERVFTEAMEKHLKENISPGDAAKAAKQLEGRELGDIGQKQLEDLRRRAAGAAASTEKKLDGLVSDSQRVFREGSSSEVVDCGFAQASAVHHLRDLGVPDSQIYAHQATEVFGGNPANRHSFVAAEVDGKLYYVDSSFGQFTDPKNAYKALGDSLPAPLRQQLATKGFVELTDANADAIGKMFNPKGRFTPADFRTQSALKEAGGTKLDDVLDFTPDEVGAGKAARGAAEHELGASAGHEAGSAGRTHTWAPRKEPTPEVVKAREELMAGAKQNGQKLDPDQRLVRAAQSLEGDGVKIKVRDVDVPVKDAAGNVTGKKTVKEIQILAEGDHPLNRYAASAKGKYSGAEIVYSPHELPDGAGAALAKSGTAGVPDRLVLPKDAVVMPGASGSLTVHETRHLAKRQAERLGYDPAYGPKAQVMRPDLGGLHFDSPKIDVDVGSLSPQAQKALKNDALSLYGKYSSVDEMSTYANEARHHAMNIRAGMSQLDGPMGRQVAEDLAGSLAQLERRAVNAEIFAARTEKQLRSVLQQGSLLEAAPLNLNGQPITQAVGSRIYRDGATGAAVLEVKLPHGVRYQLPLQVPGGMPAFEKLPLPAQRELIQKQIGLGLEHAKKIRSEASAILRRTEGRPNLRGMTPADHLSFFQAYAPQLSDLFRGILHRQ